MDIKGKIVFITGASAGIGEACAEIFAEAGTKLILMARRGEKLTKLSSNLKEKYGAECFNLTSDVRHYEELEAAINSIPPEFRNIDILINNAGKAMGMEKLHEGLLSDWEEMLETNVMGLLYVSRLIIPGMVERGSGHIINIGSIAGIEVYPNGAVYCASKHAVKALSKGMAIDLNGTGIRVTNIDPGLVETEFAQVRFHGDTEKAANVYRGYTPLTGIDIAEIALFSATRPVHVMVQNVLVTPTDQASATIVHKQL